MLPRSKYYSDKDGLRLLSYNAVFSAVISNRNYGKTWTFKKRAFKRALKHNKKTIWIRLFKDERKEAVQKFFTSADLQKYCGISLYDKDANPNGNVKQNGRCFYYRRSPSHKWQWFLKVYNLKEAGALRSVDDVDVDTIIFDEFTKPSEMYSLYHGNIATDFIDIFFSTKREHIVKCFFIGNKESFSNPIFNYFGIKPLPANYEGIASYRHGSFVVQQINNVKEASTSYDKQVSNLLEGTAYGDYIYKSKYKGASAIKQRKTPATASLYVQVDINSNPIKISVENGYFYINQRIDESKPVYADNQSAKHRHLRILVRRHKRYFAGFIEALADNRVYYDNEATKEATAYFLQWLGV